MTIGAWANSEKRLAREVFEAAAQAEAEELLADFKSRVALAESMEDVWAMTARQRVKSLSPRSAGSDSKCCCSEPHRRPAFLNR
jgi:hypothetical protein